MKHNDLFTIEYQLHGEPKSFIVRAPRMDNAGGFGIGPVVTLVWR